MIRSIVKSYGIGGRPRLTRASRYGYLTPVDKPITSLALNSIIELSEEALTYCHTELSFNSELSVMVGAFGFRICLQFMGLFFQSLNMKHKDNRVHRWIQKIFLVDLRRDITFYELPPQKYSLLAKYYKPEQLFTTIIKSYTILNFLRAGYSLITTLPAHPIISQASIISLTTHDPYFVLPVFVMGINYALLSGSRHPFLIHMVRPENKLMCFNIAFMTGLLVVGTPSIFSLSYIGIGLAHLTTRLIRYRVTDWKEYLIGLLKFFKRKT